jgi:phosphodiesterase/alkaline phosphatase D-like protein
MNWQNFLKLGSTRKCADTRRASANELLFCHPIDTQLHSNAKTFLFTQGAFMDRRRFLNSSALIGTQSLLAPALAFAQAPAVITRDAMRPQFPSGIQSGDPTSSAAMIWARSDRPARMWVEWSSTASFANAQRIRGNYLLENTDYTGRIDLTQLPAGQEIFYRVACSRRP